MLSCRLYTMSGSLVRFASLISVLFLQIFTLVTHLVSSELDIEILVLMRQIVVVGCRHVV